MKSTMDYKSILRFGADNLAKLALRKAKDLGWHAVKALLGAYVSPALPIAMDATKAITEGSEEDISKGLNFESKTAALDSKLRPFVICSAVESVEAFKEKILGVFGGDEQGRD